MDQLDDSLKPIQYIYEKLSSVKNCIEFISKLKKSVDSSVDVIERDNILNENLNKLTKLSEELF